MSRAYPVEFRACKAWGHGPFERYNPDPGEFKSPSIGRYYFQLCTSCGSIRYRNVNRMTGAYLDSSWRYRAPKGYRATQPMSRQDYRRLYFRSEAPAQRKGNR